MTKTLNRTSKTATIVILSIFLLAGIAGAAPAYEVKGQYVTQRPDTVSAQSGVSATDMATASGAAQQTYATQGQYVSTHSGAALDMPNVTAAEMPTASPGGPTGYTTHGQYVSGYSAVK